MSALTETEQIVLDAITAEIQKEGNRITLKTIQNYQFENITSEQAYEAFKSLVNKGLLEIGHHMMLVTND